MADGISLREFGRQLDVTAEAVRKAIATGKIPADCVGEVRRGNKLQPCIIAPERAAKAWGRNRNENLVRDKATLSAGAKRGWAQRRGDDAQEDDALDGDASPATNGSGKNLKITDYNTITAAYKARMAKLEYEERIGKLVNADQVKVGFVNMVTSARNRLLGVPSKAKGKIPHLTVRDVEILEDLIAKALEEVAAGG